MNSIRSRLLIVFSLLILLPFCPSADAQTASAAQAQPQAGGVPASPARFKVLRTVSGTKISQSSGQFQILDPRSTFSITDDKRIYVYFEWEGPAGTHHFEGFWKDPAGKTTVISSYDFASVEHRFGGYWTMDLSDTTPTGAWTLEAHVDGETTGSCTVEVVASGKLPDQPTMAPLLTPAELYERLRTSSVTIQRTDALGKQSKGLGFMIGEGQVATAFQVIDGATNLRIVFPDGRAVQSNLILARNRREDWAVVKVEGAGPSALPAAKPGSWSVGDRCAFLQVQENGNRALDECAIIGKDSMGEAGPRITIDHGPTAGSEGSALLDERGEVIGIVGGSLVPGAAVLESEDQPMLSSVGMGHSLFHGPLATPFSAVKLPAANAQALTLQDLAGSGDLLPPVSYDESLASAMMTTEVKTSNDLPFAVNGRFDFSRSNPYAYALLIYEPKQKCKCTLQADIYDMDNRLVTQGAPMDAKLSKTKKVFWTVKIGLAALPPAVYRVDVKLEGKLIWRDFFRVTD